MCLCKGNRSNIPYSYSDYSVYQKHIYFLQLLYSTPTHYVILIIFFGFCYWLHLLRNSFRTSCMNIFVVSNVKPIWLDREVLSFRRYVMPLWLVYQFVINCLLMLLNWRFITSDSTTMTLICVVHFLPHSYVSCCLLNLTGITYFSV
jgi:uncharacterized membrane-anchored protein YitT (DUF2179 family)